MKVEQAGRIVCEEELGGYFAGLGDCNLGDINGFQSIAKDVLAQTHPLVQIDRKELIKSCEQLIPPMLKKFRIPLPTNPSHEEVAANNMNECYEFYDSKPDLSEKIIAAMEAKLKEFGIEATPQKTR